MITLAYFSKKLKQIPIFRPFYPSLFPQNIISLSFLICFSFIAHTQLFFIFLGLDSLFSNEIQAHNKDRWTKISHNSLIFLSSSRSFTFIFLFYFLLEVLQIFRVLQLFLVRIFCNCFLLGFVVVFC